VVAVKDFMLFVAMGEVLPWGSHQVSKGLLDIFKTSGQCLIIIILLTM